MLNYLTKKLSSLAEAQSKVKPFTDNEIRVFTYKDYTIRTFFYDFNSKIRGHIFTIDGCDFGVEHEKNIITLHLNSNSIFKLDKTKLINNLRKELLSVFLLLFKSFDTVCLNKYINHFEECCTNIYFHKLKNLLKYSEFNKFIIDIKFSSNEFEIHFNDLYTNQFIYKDLKIYHIPSDIQVKINSICFVVNNNLDIVDTMVYLNKKEHPNVNKNNKYCMGNYRHKKLNLDNIDLLITNIQIYNTVNSFGISRSLQEYLKTLENIPDDTFFI